MTIANKQARLTFWAAALGVTDQYYKGVKMSQVNFVREVRHLGDAMYDEWIEHVDDDELEIEDHMKDCDTCKHDGTSTDEEPCNTCLKYSNAQGWEPKQ